jgi:acyl-CoA thioesterase FadM
MKAFSLAVFMRKGLLLPISLKQLVQEEGISCTPRGLVISVSPRLIVEGEDRLSYTTMICFVECCREHHWNMDVLPSASGVAIDSITKAFACEFNKPILVGSVFHLVFTVINVGERSYSLLFEAEDLSADTIYATFKMISVFYNPVLQKTTYPPDAVIRSLLSKCNSKT